MVTLSARGSCISGITLTHKWRVTIHTLAVGSARLTGTVVNWWRCYDNVGAGWTCEGLGTVAGKCAARVLTYAAILTWYWCTIVNRCTAITYMWLPCCTFDFSVVEKLNSYLKLTSLGYVFVFICACNFTHRVDMKSPCNPVHKNTWTSRQSLGIARCSGKALGHNCQSLLRKSRQC